MGVVTAGVILFLVSNSGILGELVPHYTFDGFLTGSNPFAAWATSNSSTAVPAGGNTTERPNKTLVRANATDERAGADSNTCSSSGTRWFGGAVVGEDVGYPPESPEPYFWEGW